MAPERLQLHDEVAGHRWPAAPEGKPDPRVSHRKRGNPHQPIVTHDHYEAVLAVADQVTVRVVQDGKWVQVPTYLSEVLVVAQESGRRISSVRRLRFSDLLLNLGPCGCIRWAWEFDKEDNEWVALMSPDLRATIDRIRKNRGHVGAVPLFPPRNQGSRYHGRRLRAGCTKPKPWGRPVVGEGTRLARIAAKVGHGTGTVQ